MIRHRVDARLWIRLVSTSKEVSVRHYIFAAMMSFFLGVSVAHADAVYTYTGLPLSGGGNVTGTVTVASALQPNTYYASINPLEFSFIAPYIYSGESYTFTKALVLSLGGRYNFYDISTDSLGDIVRYDIYASTGSNSVILEHVDYRSSNYDLVEFYPAPDSATSGPGAFATASTAVTPEPSSFILLGTGMIGLLTLAKGRSGYQSWP